MGSRTLPWECEHGVTVDWGDFGPCQDCSTDHPDETDRCPNFTECADCTADRVEAEHDKFRDDHGRFHFMCDHGHHVITSKPNLVLCPAETKPLFGSTHCGEAIDRRVIQNVTLTEHVDA